MKERVAIVAGVGPGVGLAVARRFAREGYDVGLLARSASRLETFRAELASLGVRAHAVPLDLCQPETVAPAVAEIREALAAPSVLVYNAARWHEAKAIELPPEVFASDLALSVGGALACAQAVYPDMKARGGGSLLFTGGGLALHPEYGAGVASLSAGKAALRNLTFALAKELEPDDVHVGTVTIAGTVAEGTPFDPALIAERFWALHNEPRDAWTVEHVYRGA